MSCCFTLPAMASPPLRGRRASIFQAIARDWSKPLMRMKPVELNISHCCMVMENGNAGSTRLEQAASSGCFCGGGVEAARDDFPSAPAFLSRWMQ